MGWNAQSIPSLPPRGRYIALKGTAREAWPPVRVLSNWSAAKPSAPTFGRCCYGRAYALGAHDTEHGPSSLPGKSVPVADGRIGVRPLYFI